MVFNCVDYRILLRKLAHYGIGRTMLNLFQSYLTNRIQMCKIDHTVSKKKFCCGVPEGSNLGPLLFCWRQSQIYLIVYHS